MEDPVADILALPELGDEDMARLAKTNPTWLQLRLLRTPTAVRREQGAADQPPPDALWRIFGPARGRGGGG